MMAKVVDKPTVAKPRKAKPTVSKLGRDLRRISDQIKASGEKMLTREELEQEIADLRAGRF
jgi:hypothetical protein